MDILSDVLGLLKLQGTLYFRTAFSPPWGVQVPAFEKAMSLSLLKFVGQASLVDEAMLPS